MTIREGFVSRGLVTDFKEQVRAATDIVALIGETIALQPRRGGRDYVGLCPFHDDHNPSMTVSPERQSYKCWSCNEGGDCFSFLMKIENIDFREALEMLAQRAHIELPRQDRRSTSPDGPSRQTIYEAIDWTRRILHEHLMQAPSSASARHYFVERGFEEETLVDFQIGFHPFDWEWLLTRARGQFDVETLTAANIVRARKDQSGYHDEIVFLDRVMFPIHDTRGRCVAFGGRILPESTREDAPKYLNSAESPLFAKSRLLYGLDRARDQIRKTKTAVVVEGYTDCMMAHQYGLTEVVGTLGTALTEIHVQELKRFAQKVILVFDGDDAGMAAAERSLTTFLAADVDLRILTLPAGADPADFLIENGAEAFREALNGAPEAWEHKLQVCLGRYPDTVDGRERALAEMLDLMAASPRLSGTQREDLILRRLPHRFGVSEHVVRRELKQHRHRTAHAPKKPHLARSDNRQGAESETTISEDRDRPVMGNSKTDILEKELLGVMFAMPSTVRDIQQSIRTSELGNASVRQLVEMSYSIADSGEEPTFDRILARLEDPELKRFAVEIDEQARRTDVSRRLMEQKPTEGDHLPGFLRQIIDNWKWNQRMRTHLIEQEHASGRSMAKATLDSASITMLRSASQLHRERASR